MIMSLMSLSQGDVFFFDERLVALVGPRIFVSHTIEKLGRTLEPCNIV